MKIDVLMKVEGGDELRRALRKMPVEAMAELGRALPEEASALMAAAQAGVPRATGELAASALVTSTVKPATVKAAAAYTDDKAPAVHEIQGTRGWKWFEKALNRFEGGFIERIAARLRRLVGGGS